MYGVGSGKWAYYHPVGGRGGREGAQVGGLGRTIPSTSHEPAKYTPLFKLRIPIGLLTFLSGIIRA